MTMKRVMVAVLVAVALAGCAAPEQGTREIDSSDYEVDTTLDVESQGDKMVVIATVNYYSYNHGVVAMDVVATSQGETQTATLEKEVSSSVLYHWSTVFVFNETASVQVDTHPRTITG